MSDRRRIYDRIGRAGMALIVLTVADKLLALVREMIVARQFGISAALDAFNIAWAVPGIICLFCSGAMTGAFIPLYLQWSRTGASDNNSRLLIWCVGLLCAAVTLVLTLTAQWFFPALGFGLDESARPLGITAARLLALLVLFDGAGILLGAVLQAEKRFVSLQTAPLFINVVTIPVVLIAHRRLGIFALIAGLLAGTACKTLFLASALRRRGFPLLRRPCYDRDVVRRFTVLALPLLGSELIVNLNFIVDQVMAGMLATGSVSTLKYAYRVYDLPVQIIIIAMAKALFPFVSETALEEGREGLRRMFQHALLFLGFITVPMLCTGMLFSTEIVKLLFERGAFDPAATMQTARTFVCYNAGLFFYAYAFINGTFFSAMQATGTLFRMGCLSVGLNILLNALFMRCFGVQGIALSTSVTVGILDCGFIVLIVRRLGMPDGWAIGRNFLRIGVAAVCMCGAGLALQNTAGTIPLPWAARLWLGMCLMLGVYALCIWRLKTAEIERYIAVFRRILGRMEPP